MTGRRTVCLGLLLPLALGLMILSSGPARAGAEENLRAWALEAKAVKQDELARLEAGQAPVNGYAVMGRQCPPDRLSGDPEKDQACSYQARIEILEQELASLDRVLAYLDRQGPAAPGPGTPGPSYPAPYEDDSNLVNGSFSRGLEGWVQSRDGYGASGGSDPTWWDPPRTDSGCLRLAVYGGTQSMHQVVRLDDPRQEFRVRFRVEQWSTYQSGRPGGWAAVALSFLDGDGGSLATTYFYLNPLGPAEDRQGIIWKRLSPALPLPTPWIPVRVRLDRLAAEHGLAPDMVDSVRITAIAFGTHEDRRPTVVCFDDFQLIGTPGSEGGYRPDDTRPPGYPSQPILSLDRTTVRPGGPITIHFRGAQGLDRNAWIGIIPSGVPHGDERTNNDNNLSFQHLQGRAAGSLTFRAPTRPGYYDFRMHDSDERGREIAFISFTVEDTGGSGPSPYPPPPSTWPRPSPEPQPMPLPTPEPGPRPWSREAGNWLGSWEMRSLYPHIRHGRQREWRWHFTLTRQGPRFLINVHTGDRVTIHSITGRTLSFSFNDRLGTRVDLRLTGPDRCEGTVYQPHNAGEYRRGVVRGVR